MPDYLQRNRPHAKQTQTGTYQTALQPQNEIRFRNWLKANAEKSNAVGYFDPSNMASDYDMRGWWLTNKGAAPPQGSDHFPDTFKTPYHETFSNESQYALPTAPKWVKTQAGRWALVANDGSVLKVE